MPAPSAVMEVLLAKPGPEINMPVLNPSMEGTNTTRLP